MPEGDAVRYRGLDLYNHRQFQQAVQNTVNTARVLPHKDLQDALSWYDREHETIARSIRKTSLTHRQGSGITASIKTSMNYADRNVSAISEVKKIKQATWNQIYAHHQAVEQWRTTPKAQRGQAPPRQIPGLQGSPIGQATAANLIKAHKIYTGEAKPEDVLTSPKYSGFFKSLADPQAEEEEHPEHDPVAVDFRQHDVTHGKILPSQLTRGALKNEPIKGKSRITSAQPGDPSGYEMHAKVLRSAADVMGVRLRKQMQAGSWVGGKAIETHFGKYKQIPMSRVGQPYFMPGGVPNLGGRQGRPPKEPT
jgi:hypothetical protein